MALTVKREQAAGMIEIGVVANRGKEIQDFAVICRGIANAVRREHRQAAAMRDTNRSLIAPLFLALMMALKLDVDIIRPEDADQPFDRLAASFFTAAHQSSSQRAFVATGQANQARGVLLQDRRSLAEPSCFVVSRILNCVMSWQRF